MQRRFQFKRFIPQRCRGAKGILFIAVWLTAISPSRDRSAFAGDAKEPVIPHAQTKVPGPALSPQEAQAKMTVPEGFRVDLVAAEPDLLNPVAMTWDDRGRIWVCESLEYPRIDAGEGKDRIRIHEDTDNDGKTDTVKTFAEGFNIPAGIAIGYGGVFVANAPDLLFLQDTDGDDKADKTEVIFSGFGREDVHEVPNCLTWGPDGWLYGLNGVFNPTTISYQGETHKFTCALWRYHPVLKKFELFAEGTSNPWGLDYNANGHWFVSACVIDHLWHLTQTGYYHRQGGAYRSNVWKIGSIVNHRHQMQAYCGLAIYDADVYPAEYRRQIFMGNIHAGCINRDELIRSGSSYFAEGKDDFLSANDVWFMPTSIKVGPDGSFWVLDWYDRYHCYQDARRDPEGVDRLHGRLWRVVYGDTPMPNKFDLNKFSNDQLIEKLSDPNVWWRRKARRILTERNDPATVEPLKSLAMSSADSRGPTEALWTLISMGRIDAAFHGALLTHENATFRLWGVRAAAELGKVDANVFAKLKTSAADPSPDVRLQVAIASARIDHADAFGLLLAVMSHEGKDALIPHIAWENLHPRFPEHAGEFVDWLIDQPIDRMPIASAVADRAVNLMVPRKGIDPGPFRQLLSGTLDQKTHLSLARKCLNGLWAAIQAGELPDRGEKLFDEITREKIAAFSKGKGSHAMTATAILTAWSDRDAVSASQRTVDDPSAARSARVTALQALVLIDDPGLVGRVGGILGDSAEAGEIKGDMISAIGSVESPAVGDMLIERWGDLVGGVQQTAIDVLSGRVAWATGLMAAIELERIPRTAVNTNHVRKMVHLKNEALSARIEQVWGLLREDRNPDREKVVNDMKLVLEKGKRNPVNGQRVFKQLCIQCHKMYGQGAEVGPDLTGNGRATLDQLLSNVLDPNLVIGSGYVARNVWSKDGQVINGLVVEDTDARVVLKITGGEEKIIPRDMIEEMRVSKISLMPEELEKAISEQEFRDLIGFMLTGEAPTPWSEVPDLPAKNY
jgi:putative membrane-bound dehydrogenase-like protein